MKYYKKNNVLEESKLRIAYLFDEFENVVVSISGGKDSTTVFNLCLEEARKRGRLPLKTMWIDQEGEWQGTVDYCNQIMRMPEVEPFWFQIPMVITNNANTKERYAKCWEEGVEWLHPKSDISIKKNIYGTERFHELFEKITLKEWGNKKTCMIAGVRAEEAPKRATALSQGKTYKWITWGKKFAENSYTFYPIYDWSYTDVWKYIQENKIKYNRVYDEMYKYGVTINNMRISNLHHETAIQVLLLVQEIEPETWNKVAKKITGANTIKHLKKNSFACPKELPSMFEDWEEYAYFLAEKLIPSNKDKESLKQRINRDKPIYFGNDIVKLHYLKAVINTVLSADWDFTKLQNAIMIPEVYIYRKYKQNKINNIVYDPKKMKFFTIEERIDLLNKIEVHKKGCKVESDKRID